MLNERPQANPNPTNRLSSYALLDALIERRSRRFAPGMRMNGGPLAFAACGISGYALAELPYQSGAQPEMGGGNIMLHFVARTAASGDASHAYTVFVMDAEGVWMLRRPQDYPRTDIPALIELARAHKLVELYERARIRIDSGRVDIPRDVQYMLPLNKWSANVPGTTYFLPIAELTALYINIMPILFDTEFACFVLDERNGFQPAGIGRFARSKGGPVSIEVLADESAQSLKQWAQTLSLSLQAEVLVTDDADAMKTMADALGLDQQLCRAFVNRNIHDLVAALGTKALEHPDRLPGKTELSVPQFLDDLQQVGEMIKGLPHDGQQQLELLAGRYQTAPPPQPGHKANMWYRMRMLTLDWSENWSRLTRFQSWRGPQSQKLDGTNNATERIIGQYVKERYRSMRGYKRKASITNVSSLIGWIGMQPTGYDLGEVV